MNYKKLRDYIQQVNIRNKDLEVETLLGVSNTKNLIPSIANTIGTDMSKYKILEKRQFAYGTVTSRNGDRLSIGFLTEYEKALVSQIYIVFEVIDETKLLPEYLMMWFSRPEFDRYARFHSHGSTRETFDWEDMCEVELPVPSIEKQREIVAQYQAVANKIKVNEQICEKLEATAQTLYKHWFVDFEFPITKESHPKLFCHSEPVEESTIKTYKSSGGTMVYNQELEKEIPEGWEVKNLEQVVKIFAGGDKPKVFSTVKTDNCKVPIYSNGLDNKGLYGFTNKSVFPKNSITVSARGTIGYCELRREDYVGIVRLLTLIPNHDLSSIYLFYFLQNFDFDASGSVQNQLTKPQVSEIQILYPEKLLLEQFYHIVNKIVNKKEFKNTENQKLTQLQSLLLSRLARLEG